MRVIRNVVAGAVSLLAIGTVQPARAQSGLEGVWRLTEITTMGPKGSTISNPQPGLFVFTRTPAGFLYTDLGMND